MSWSPNSPQFATASLGCSAGVCTGSTLDIYNAGTLQREATIDLTTSIDWYIPTCGLDLSTDAEYLSFVSTCAYDVADFPKDVYMWNIPSSDIDQVTNLTTPYFNTSTPGTLNAHFENVWLDARTLLMNTVNGVTGTLELETLAYDPLRGLTSLSFNQYIEDWTFNPVASQFGYRTFTDSSYEPQNAAIHIAELQHNSLNVLTTLPAGCNLSWSPDGEWLAYTTHGTSFISYCSQPEEGITLYNRITGESTEIDISEYTGGIIPVGWVVAPL